MADYLVDFVADHSAATALQMKAEENREERQRVPLDAADGDDESAPVDSTAREAKDDEKDLPDSLPLLGVPTEEAERRAK